MRVLIVHNRYRTAQPSGENTVVEEEARLLADSGCTISRLESRSDEIETWGILKRGTLPFGVIWSRGGYARARDAIQSFGPDVVHFHNTFPLPSPAALWAARRSGVPVVQTLHNYRPLCPAATFLREGLPCEDCLGRIPIPAVLHGCYRNSRLATVPIAAMVATHRAIGTWQRCVDTLIVPAEFARTKYVQAGWPAARIEVKYNTAPDTAVRRNGAGSGFLCVSRLGNEKGVDLLLDAWGKAFPDGGESLRVVGSGEDETNLRAQAKRLQGVDFLGQVEPTECVRLMAESRALIIPSRTYEVFPRALVEAYSAGVPVVAWRMGAFIELVSDGRTGLLAEPRSTSALADQLRTLSRSASLSLRLGEGARRAYDERYSPSRTTERLLAIYEDVKRSRSRNGIVGAGHE